MLDIDNDIRKLLNLDYNDDQMYIIKFYWVLSDILNSKGNLELKKNNIKQEFLNILKEIKGLP